MSIICPKCGKELDDDVRVCDACGQVIDEETEPKTTLVEDAPAEEADAAPAEQAVEEAVEEAAEEAVEDTVEEAAEESADTEGEDSEEAASSEEAAAEPVQGAESELKVAVPLQDQPEKEKKNKYLGLGIGVGLGIAALIAAVIVGIVLLIPQFTGPQNAVSDYINAYKDSDFEKYFSHDYAVMYKNDNLDEQVEMAKQYATDTGAEDLEVKVLKVADFSADAKKNIIDQLETAGYHDTDKIQELKTVVLEISRPHEGEEEDAGKDYWASMFYALKVDGDWYFATGF